MGLPPVVPGVQFAVAVMGLPLVPFVAARMAGAPGAVGPAGTAGVTLLDGADWPLVSGTALVAVTVKWTAVPFARPVTTRLVAPAGAGRGAPTGALPAVNTLTVKPVIAAPPLLVGAVQLTVAEALPAVAVPMAGTDGADNVAAGVTVLEKPDCGPVPTALVALTVNFTGVAGVLVKPVKTRLVTPAPSTVCVPSGAPAPVKAWTEKPVMTLPPLLVGAVQVTVAEALPPVAEPIVGAVGAVGAVPVPFTTTVVGEPAPLLTMLIVAVCATAVVGWNVTLTVQLAPGASDAQLPAGACVAVKDAALAPVTLIADTVTVPVPELVTVIALGAEVVLMVWLAKAFVAGVAEIAGTRNTGAEN